MPYWCMGAGSDGPWPVLSGLETSKHPSLTLQRSLTNSNNPSEPFSIPVSCLTNSWLWKASSKRGRDTQKQSEKQYVFTNISESENPLKWGFGLLALVLNLPIHGWDCRVTLQLPVLLGKLVGNQKHRACVIMIWAISKCFWISTEVDVWVLCGWSLMQGRRAAWHGNNLVLWENDKCPWPLL